MSDADLRELERRFRVSGSQEDEAALLRARLQAGELDEGELRLRAYRGEPGPRAALEGAAPLERWDLIVSCAARWYTTPLGPDDGVSAAEIAEAEARLGFRLPEVLREWFRLVGRRVRFANQDHPVPFDELELRDGSLTLLWENQGNWRGGLTLAELDSGAVDPLFSADLSDFDLGVYQAPLSGVLQLFVLSETALHGSLGWDAIGPLGPMCGGIRAASVADYAEAYPRLSAQDYLGFPLHGDAETIIRSDMGVAITRSPAAWDRLSPFVTR